MARSVPVTALQGQQLAGPLCAAVAHLCVALQPQVSQQTAAGFQVETYDDLRRYLLPVMEWFGLMQKVEQVGCPGAPELIPLVDAKLQQFTTVYSAALPGAGTSSIVFDAPLQGLTNAARSF